MDLKLKKLDPTVGFVPNLLWSICNLSKGAGLGSLLIFKADTPGCLKSTVLGMQGLRTGRMRDTPLTEKDTGQTPLIREQVRI